jgi:hypothetical protein
MIVWLNYPFGLILGRALRRIIGRAVRREELFAGNRETLRGAFFSRESILWWVISTYHGRRRRYRALLQAGNLPHLVEEMTLDGIARSREPVMPGVHEGPALGARQGISGRRKGG